MGRKDPKRNSKKAKKKWKDFGENSTKDKPINPFEIRKQKLKKEVLNSKTRGNVVADVKARGLAENKRNETLGVEFDNRRKSNSFVDKRFVGIDPSLSVEEQKYARMQKQKQREFDKLEFGEEVPLTHGGRILDFSMIGQETGENGLDFNFVDGDEEEENMEDEFGGLEKRSNGPRTDREVYSDLISKSKMSRNLAQKERALIKDETYELDDEFDEISDLLGKYKKRESDRQKEINEMIARMNASVQSAASTEETIPESKPNPVGVHTVDVDDFDRLARELSVKARGLATNPLQTPEDIALAEKKKLQQLEEQRVRRMMGDDYVEKTIDYGADDLDDGFSLGEFDYNKKKMKKDKKDKSKKNLKASKDKYGNDKEEESSDDSDVSKDNYGNDKEKDDNSDSEDDNSSSDGSDSASDDLKDKEIFSLGADEEIPYTLKLPSSFESFRALLLNQSTDRRKVILKRLRACYNIRLSHMNKQYLERLYDYLFHFILTLSTEPTFSDPSIHSLTEVLFSIGKEMPSWAGQVTRFYLEKTEDNFKNKKVITTTDIFLFQLISKLWPITDRRHIIVSPALVTMCMGLTTTKMNTLNDIVIGLLLSSQITNYVIPANRYSNEPFLYYTSILSLFNDEIAKNVEKSLTSNDKKSNNTKKSNNNNNNNNNNNKSKEGDKGSDSIGEKGEGVKSFSITNIMPNFVESRQLFRFNLAVDKLKEIEIMPLNMKHANGNEESSIKLLLAIVNSTILLFKRYVTLFTSSNDKNFFDGSIGLFQSSRTIIDDILKNEDYYPPEIIKNLLELKSEIENNIKYREGRLMRMELLKKNSIVIHKELIPDFTDNYTGRNKKYGDVKSRESREVKFLEKKVKHERKGAEREIKLDSQFLSRKRAEKRKEMDDDRMKKTKGLMHALNVQQHDAKVLDKMSKKRRSAF